MPRGSRQISNPTKGWFKHGYLARCSRESKGYCKALRKSSTVIAVEKPVKRTRNVEIKIFLKKFKKVLAFYVLWCYTIDGSRDPCKIPLLCNQCIGYCYITIVFHICKYYLIKYFFIISIFCHFIIYNRK